MSLVELLISSTILVSVVVASMRAHVGARRGTELATEKKAAIRVVQSARVLLETAGVEDVLDSGGDVDPAVPLPVAPRLDGQTVTYALIDPAAVADGTPVGLRITCQWRGPDHETRTLEVVDAIR